MLEGLDATVLKLSQVREDNEKLRIDDGFFSKLAVFTQQRIEEIDHVRLGEACSIFRKGIFDIKADSYVEQGVPFVRIGDLKGGLIDDSDLAYITEEAHARESNTALSFGDVILSKTAYPAAALVNLPRCNASQDTIAVQIYDKWKKKLPGGFLVAYLNSRHGLALMERQFQGNVQAHLSLPDGRKLPVPLFGNIFQQAVHDAILSANDFLVESREAVAQAEKTLLRSLGLENWQPPEPLTYTRRASEALAAGRFDSEYFAPRVAQLLAKLAADGLTIHDVAPARHEVFDPAKHASDTFQYIEIGGMRGDGTATSETTPTAEAPSRASQRVRGNDIITSTVRPIRRLSAIITPDQDGHVCSSGFVVLNPTDIAPEVLLTYLRLPAVCELMDLHTSASLYPAISERDILQLPIPSIDNATTASITQSIRAAHAARQEAQSLLERAKRAVETAIEQGEAAGMEFLKTK